MSDERQIQHASDVHSAVVESPIRRRRRSGGWIKWIAGMTVIGIIFGAAIIVLMKYANDPASASGVTLAQVKASTSPTPAPPNHFTSLYIDFDYGSSFDEVQQLKSGGPNMLEQYNISSKGDYRRTIAVNVALLPSGNINDDSSYRFRLADKADYVSSTATIHGEPVVIMQKNDKTERTLFWVHGGKLVTFAVTCTNGIDNVTSLMAPIMTTARWRT